MLGRVSKWIGLQGCRQNIGKNNIDEWRKKIVEDGMEDKEVRMNG